MTKSKQDVAGAVGSPTATATTIDYIGGGRGNWVLNWETRYIVRGLRAQKLTARPQNIGHTRWGKLGNCWYLLALERHLIRNRILHFCNRYVYLHDALYKRIHPSNTVFLTWFHGNPKFGQANLMELLEQLVKASRHLRGIVVSCKISQQVLVDAGIAPAQIATIPLSIDLETFSPPTDAQRKSVRDRLGIPPSAICIGSFQKDGKGWGEGREPKLEKGPDVFLDAIARLHERYSNLHVLLTGPARGYVKQGLEAIGVPYTHSYLQNYLDIVDYYRALDLYIIASRDEGGPKALLECWATGVPLVSTQVGMAADLIQHRCNGTIVQIEDAAGLSDCAAMLIEDVELRSACRDRALNDISAYDWSRVSELYYKTLYAPYLRGSAT
ncbi:glycosyltransferase [Rubidibacter lacunae KORDI 51-2]|uniref:Glycosyltransferase n=1 Tax=Rubidibacter lacunae KORDI 51-2 TaxID=582515 RepID=U5DJ82_9CHRO|nr:glycosyltransferase family 4 protein [Rubidibacter lacunae]ERN41751.1 glycosyltransferase [Rubidibacter lacunae KORDI 51-2]